jgi:tRNA modification GTPase
VSQAGGDTIFALSSGAPPAAIAVVRISGPKADEALERLAGRLPEPRRARLAELREGEELLDCALVLRLPGPGSATGEDLAELHLHGGRSVVSAVLGALSAMDGLRPALPGEFTRRAFENGRIDLAEAEGLADLLLAETQSQRRAALALAGGMLSRRVEGWQARLLTLSAQVEARLDFSDEDDVDEALPAAWHQSLDALRDEMEAVLARPGVERLRDGVRVVIAGPPNSGKSSLLNALAQKDAAITSPVAGTTRDVIEAPVAIAGTPFLLLDTAGLREGEEAVEQAGIARALEAVEGADLVLWLGEPGDCPERERAILVQPKIDMATAEREADVRLSSLTGEGLETLSALLVERSRSLLPAEGDVALNKRQRGMVAEALMELRCDSGDLLVVAESLRLARGALDRVTGRAGVEDMLDGLFGRFCIGK